MNSTSPSSRLVRIAARSPARSSAGPLVMRRLTSISAATMPDSVVLPRPGGPANSRWSAAWPRPRAAASMISRCSLQARLADELVEPARPERGLLGLLDRIGRRRCSSSSLIASRSRVRHRQELERLAQEVLDRARPRAAAPTTSRTSSGA